MLQQVLATALTPIINMLSIAGLISIPGMMTGQILAGGDAIVAAKYQILIMFGIGASGTSACMLSMGLALLTLTDGRHCLRLDRLEEQPTGWLATAWCADTHLHGLCS